MSTAATATAPSSKALHITLWVVQILLGVAFVMSGTTKLLEPIAELNTMMSWTLSTGEALTRFIGLSEALGGLGLILPSLTRIKPRLSVLAALGLTTVMTLAAIFHISRGEFGVLPVNAVLGGLAAFVAWGRSKKAVIA